VTQADFIKRLVRTAARDLTATGSTTQSCVDALSGRANSAGHLPSGVPTPLLGQYDTPTD